MTEVVSALIRDGDKCMICQRPANKAHGMLWEFVGGKVEPGDIRWTTADEIPRYEFCPADETILRRLSAKDSRKRGGKA